MKIEFSQILLDYSVRTRSDVTYTYVHLSCCLWSSSESALRKIEDNDLIQSNKKNKVNIIYCIVTRGFFFQRACCNS